MYVVQGMSNGGELQDSLAECMGLGSVWQKPVSWRSPTSAINSRPILLQQSVVQSTRYGRLSLSLCLTSACQKVYCMWSGTKVLGQDSLNDRNVEIIMCSKKSNLIGLKLGN